MGVMKTLLATAETLRLCCLNDGPPDRRSSELYNSVRTLLPSIVLRHFLPIGASLVPDLDVIRMGAFRLLVRRRCRRSRRGLAADLHDHAARRDLDDPCLVLGETLALVRDVTDLLRILEHRKALRALHDDADEVQV